MFFIFCDLLHFFLLFILFFHFFFYIFYYFFAVSHAINTEVAIFISNLIPGFDRLGIADFLFVFLSLKKLTIMCNIIYIDILNTQLNSDLEREKENDFFFLQKEKKKIFFPLIVISSYGI